MKENLKKLNEGDVGIPAFAYWAEVGKLMGGPYPSCPHNKIDFSDIEALLDAGVRTFVDLTERHEVRASGLSLKQCDYREALRASCKGRGLPARIFNRAWHGSSVKDGVAYYWCPIGDLRVPKVWQVEFVLGIIERSNGPVYVHCRGGVGRTGVINGCWLIRRGMTEKEAVDRMNSERRRRHVPLCGMTSPERGSQFRFLRQWEAKERGTKFVERQDEFFDAFGAPSRMQMSLYDGEFLGGSFDRDGGSFLGRDVPCDEGDDDDGSFVGGGRHVPGAGNKHGKFDEEEDDEYGGPAHKSEWLKGWERRWKEMRRR